MISHHRNKIYDTEDNLSRIVSCLKNSRSVILSSHVSPDGDAVGALLALGTALRYMGKHVVMYNESKVPDIYRFLPLSDDIRRHLDRGVIFDTGVILDCPDLSYIGNKAKILNAHNMINIDHHTDNRGFGDFQLIDPNACGTAEIVYRIIKKLPVTIDEAIATAIYTGILTDTGSFRLTNTNAEAFAISAEMMDFGALPYQVACHIFGEYSLGRIKLLNRALDSVEISGNGKVSVMILTQQELRDTGTSIEDINGIVNYAFGIEGVKIAALITEAACPNTYHVNLRSNGDVDMADVAMCYGGTGTKHTGSFSIKSPLTVLKGRIFNLFNPSKISPIS